jgi:hypothetical protein
MDHEHAWRCAAALALALGLGCGVQEHPHAHAAVDTSNDFGPSPSAGANGPASPPPAAAGSASPAAGSGNAGQTSMATAGVPGNPRPAGAAAAPRAGQVADAGAAPMSGAPAAPSAGAGGPASGTTIDIGGTTVAKENVIAFIHFGHSNMAGRAVGPTATRPYFFTETDPHGWMYHVGQALQPAKEPFTAGDDLSGTYGGPGTALIKQAAAMAPDKYFVSLGFGKTSAYCSQFLPGSLYYDSVMKAPIAIKDRVTFGAIVILLGITERHGTSADITGFSSCINQLVTAVRKDVGRPDLPMLLNDYEQEATGALAATSSFAKSIIPEIHKVPMVVSNSALVATDKLSMEDDHHFNFDGHKEYTRRVLQTMKDKGWFPWAQ